MLKILGGGMPSIAVFILNEFGYLAFLSSLVGAALSIAVSFALNAFLFQLNFEFSLIQPLISVALITTMSIVISLIAGFWVFHESPLEIIREGNR
jgi:putative ABC transport system permease protein